MGNISTRPKPTIEGDIMLERPSKRLKIRDSALAAAATASNRDSDKRIAFELPPEVWAMTLNYLDFQSVLTCATTSRSILHDAMPQVTMLHIDKTNEMNATLACRFRDVREINIFSLFVERGADDFLGERGGFDVDHDAIMRVVPFLSCFPALEQVFFGKKKSTGEEVDFCFNGDLWDGNENRLSFRLSREYLQSLIDMLCGSFRCGGGLTEHIRVLGLRCLDSANNESGWPERISTCIFCQRACQNFPLDQVINFESNGSPTNNGRAFSSRGPGFLGVCLERYQIESIAEARPGGAALLRSDARFLYLLGRGDRFEIPSDGGKPLVIVMYSGDQMGEIIRVIQYANLDVKKMSSCDLTRAFMRSFAKDSRSPLPPMNRCFLSPTSFNFLRHEIGLSIHKEDFRNPAVANLKNLPQIAKGILSDTTAIQHDCVVLLYYILTDVEKPPILQIINLGVVPQMVNFLSSGYDWRCQRVAVGVLDAMFRKGSNTGCMQIVVDAGAIPSLVRLLSSTRNKVALKSAVVLGRIARKSTIYRDRVLEGGAMAPLLRLATTWASHTDRKTTWWTMRGICSGYPVPSFAGVEPHLEPLGLLFNDDGHALLSALVKLSHFCTLQLVDAMSTGAFPRLLELVNHCWPEVQMKALSTINRILSLSNDRSLVQLVISNNVFPTLVSCLSSPVENVKEEASSLITQIQGYGTDEQFDEFVSQGSVKALCDLLALRKYSDAAPFALSVLSKKLKPSGNVNETCVGITKREIQLLEAKLSKLENEIKHSEENWDVLNPHIRAVRVVLDCMAIRYSGAAVE